MIKKPLIQTIIVFVILLICHLGLNHLLNSISVSDVLTIHIILFALTLGGLLLLQLVKKHDENKIGLTFLAISTIKLLISVSIILVLLKVAGRPKEIAIHFSGAYFLYIIFLSIKTFSMLNSNISIKK